MEATEGEALIPSSVVVLPEPEHPEDRSSPLATSSLKRRQSSSSNLYLEGEAKRRRLSDDTQDAVVIPSTGTSNKALEPALERKGSISSTNTYEQRSSRGTVGSKGGFEEERNRGKRLFGSLIGTLSQSSSSSAMMVKQKRRADIDRKQQEKLKQQDEEFSEAQQKKLDDLNSQRRKDQLHWNEQSMRIRHSSLLATANFLSTEADPKLYYKPWQLKPEEETRIQNQIEEARQQIAQELGELGEHTPTTLPAESGSNHYPNQDFNDAELTKETQVSENGVVHINSTEEFAKNTANHAPLSPTNKDTGTASIGNFENGIAKDIGEDNEEVVVEAGGEDAVIW